MDEKLTSLQNQLQKLHQEIESLKTTPKDSIFTHRSYDIDYDELERAQNNLLEIMKKITSESDVKFMSVCFTSTSYNGTGSGTGTSMFNSLDSIDEDALATNLEVFTNPRRITILKNLIDAPLHANEISQRTGFVGGQLYHHLNILEEAGLIRKENDKFYANGDTQGKLASLVAVVGGMR